MKRLLLVALALAMLAGPAAALKFRIASGPIHIEGQPGTTHTRTFHLSLAPDQKATRFRIMARDWLQAEEGGQSIYRPPGTTPHSCARWLQIEPREVEVQPGGRLDVQVTVRIPLDAAPRGYWGILTLEEIPDPRIKAIGTGIRFNAQINAGVWVDVGSIDRQAVIEAVDLRPDEAMVCVANRGNAPLHMTGRLEFFRPDRDERVASVEMQRRVVLTDPAPRLRFRVPFPPPGELPEGSYRLRVLLDIQGLSHYVGAQKLVQVRRHVGRTNSP